MKNLVYISICIILFAIQSCKEVDDLPPVITLTGDTLVIHSLNVSYVDQGATATDETDGNLTTNIYIENTVNENLLGRYTVTYKVVDKAGNEAAPVVRNVRVINNGYIYMGSFNLEENQTFPDPQICNSNVEIEADSTLNYRIIFTDFACGSGFRVYADVADTVIIIPFQLMEDSLQKFSLQGSGFINENFISLEYTYKTDIETSLWEAELNRVK